MRKEDFTPDAPGKIVRTLDGAYWAFVPNPLPATIGLDEESIDLLVTAADAVGRLRGVGQTLPNPTLVSRPFARREAVLSSRIEGTTASVEDLLLFDAGAGDILAEPDDAREVSNHLAALSVGLDMIQRLPVCNRLICDVHAVLIRGVRGHEKRPGEFRNSQNMISGGADGPRFVPPPVIEMRRAMDDLERYIGARAARPPLLIQLALIHYQFETIHPFMDGNGRMGRLLIPLILHERGALPLPLLYLSAYFERWKDEYRDHLLRVSQTGQWKPWIDFFLRGVVEQAYEAVAISEELVTLRERYRQETTGPRVPSNVQTVIDMLFEGPAITASDIRSRLGVSSRTAYDLLGRLEALGIVREATGKQYGKVYLAPGIVRATMLAGRPRQEDVAPPQPIDAP